MSMRTYANHGYIIPKSVLEANLPEEIKFISENEEQFVEWVQDGDFEDENISKFEEINERIKEWGKSKGLELSIDYTPMDEDNEEIVGWLCFCDNAVTVNPAFSEIGGESHLWTTWG